MPQQTFNDYDCITVSCLKNFTSRGNVYVGNITVFFQINYGLENFGNGPLMCLKNISNYYWGPWSMTFSWFIPH